MSRIDYTTHDSENVSTAEVRAMTADPLPSGSDEGRGRGRPRDARSHAAILATTLDLLVEVGYQRLTLEEVARRGGVGKATIYRWWDSKLDLVLEAATPHLQIGLVPDTGNTRSDLEAAIEQVIATYSDPIAAIVIFVVIADLEQDSRLREIFRTTWVHPWRESLADAIQRGVARGDLPTGLDVQFLIDLLVGMVFQRVLIIPSPLTGGLSDSLVDLVMEADLPRS
jgi:AcrR family transcriptional regulator